jgi:predicted RNase H-related nuclease YkuK (DUF458 family)
MAKIRKYELEDIIEKYMEMYEKDMVCDVRVGTDSQMQSKLEKKITDSQEKKVIKKSVKYHKFITIVCLHFNRSSLNYNGGDERISLLWAKKSWVKANQVNGIVHKMVTETLKTVEVANELAEIIDRENIICELDINQFETHASSEALDACKGICIANGFENVLYKPDALTTYAADRFAKKKN